ncbi:MAG TPA: hypothetical protein VEQ84_04780 [Vicinamibacteria bacterium]|nr:hypothetical protein [Vicinamibacteria bacterium]
MKKFALLLSLVFVAGVAVADEAKKPEAPKAPEKAVAAKTEAKADATKAVAAKGKTHEVTAEVVSVDAEKNTITIKGETENKTAPVDAKAAGALKTVKAGDKVTLTCWDNAKGEHEKVIAIVPAKVAAPAKQ